MLNWIVFLLVGLVAGTLAKALMPGGRKEPAGWVMTMLLGVIGAYVAGWLFSFLLGWNVEGNLLGAIASSTIGAMLLIGLMRAFSK